jgi:hypothetical protein
MPSPNLLTQNSELRKDRIWNWTLPAWVVRTFAELELQTRRHRPTDQSAA